ncbi:MAG: peptidylprolyl isomerase [Acidobacteriota bacterium]|nr:peptidylprolyl isomerase [Acidobacteriota bacterium]
MKLATVVLVLALPAGWSQTAPASSQGSLSSATPPATPSATPNASKPVSPDTIVAEVDGKKYTAAEISKLLEDFPPDMHLAIQSNPKSLGLILLTRYLAGEAAKAKLDQQSPLKEALAYQRLQAMAQAEINQVSNFQINPTPEQEEQFYKEHPDRYQEAKIRVIYVAFVANPVASADPKSKKSLSEPEAKRKIEDLRKQLNSGADFAQLAKNNSDDKESAGKGGEFPPLKRNSAYPEEIKKAVFDLKPGQVSQPLRQANGFYLIRLEEVKTPPFEEVRVQIYEEMKRKDFNEWMQGLQKRYEVKVENPDFFKPQTGVPVPPKPSAVR